MYKACVLHVSACELLLQYLVFGHVLNMRGFDKTGYTV